MDKKVVNGILIGYDDDYGTEFGVKNDLSKRRMRRRKRVR